MLGDGLWLLGWQWEELILGQMLGDPVPLLCWLLKRTSLSPEGPVPSWLCSLSPGSWALGK